MEGLLKFENSQLLNQEKVYIYIYIYVYMESNQPFI